MKLHTALYRAARIANNMDAVANPERAPRRAKNLLLGRLLSGVFRNLWK